jgi:hypothetical protein
MDESSLRALIDSLNSQQTSLGNWLDIFSGLVVVGVLAEIVFVFWEYWGDRHDWQHGIGFVWPPHPPSFSKLVWELIGVLLVSGGVAGEFVIDKEVGGVETSLRTANADLVFLLGRDVRDAADSLQLANQRLAVIEGKAGKLDERLNAAGLKVDAVSLKGEDVGKQEAQLQAEVEDADLIFAADASGHTLLPRLFNSLKFLHPAKLEIQYFIDAEPKTRLFAQKLGVAFKNDFGWTVLGNSPRLNEPIGMMVPGRDGITIFNKWYTSAAPLVIGMGPEDVSSVEADPSFFEKEIESACPGITKEEAQRLSTLAVALGARLEKEPAVGEDSLWIFIGSSEHTNVK